MSGAARFDIRLPIGGLFLLLGGVLTAYGALYASLVDRQQTLQSMQALQPSVASVLRQAAGDTC